MKLTHSIYRGSYNKESFKAAVHKLSVCSVIFENSGGIQNAIILDTLLFIWHEIYVLKLFTENAKTLYKDNLNLKFC